MALKILTKTYTGYQPIYADNSPTGTLFVTISDENDCAYATTGTIISTSFEKGMIIKHGKPKIVMQNFEFANFYDLIDFYIRKFILKYFDWLLKWQKVKPPLETVA